MGRGTWAALALGSMLVLPVASLGLPGDLGDCGAAGDAGGDFASARRLAAPAACVGTVRVDMDGEDWYRFDAAVGDAAHVAGVGALLDPSGVDLSLIRPDGSVADHAAADVAGVVADIDMAGAWRLRVRAEEPANGTYGFTLALAPSDEYHASCEPFHDASGTPAGSTPLSTPTVCTGRYDARRGDGEDWYSFHAVAGGLIAVDGQFLLRVGLPPSVELHRPDGSFVGTSRILLTNSVVALIDQTGTWRVRVGPFVDCWPGEDCRADYVLTVSVTPPG